LPGDYDLKLYRNSTNVATSQNAGTASETINYTAAANTYYARVYGYNGANSATQCYTLKVQLGTASKPGQTAPSATDKKQLFVYPNPAHTIINVNLTGYKGVSEMKLYDANGKQVAVYRTSDIRSTIDMSKLSSGVYMLKIITANGEVLTQKVIKQ
jgi:hypothetical protein